MAFDLLEAEPTAADARVAPHRVPAIIAYVILIGAIVAGFAVGGRASMFANAGLSYAPFVVLAVLAYLGVRQGSAKVLTIMWQALLMIGGALAVLGFSMMASGALGLDPAADPTAGLSAAGPIIGQVGLGIFAAFVIGLLCFIPPLRRGLSYFLPLDSSSFVHTVALATVVAFTIMMAAPLLVLGEPPMLAPAVMNALPADALDETTGLLGTLFTLIWSIPLAILAVGYGISRNFSDTLQRLGFVRPTVGQVILGIVVALVLVGILWFIEDWQVQFWQSMGWPQTDAEAFSELLAFAFTPLGAVVVAISAGVGEELAIRGVLQPRLGILLSNAFFTSLHAFQYNWDALLVVFVVGLVMGVAAQVYQYDDQRNCPWGV